MAQPTKCPFCEATIIGDATVCHYCGRDMHSADGGPAESGAKAAWRTARTFLIVVVVALALIALVFAIRSWLARPIPLPLVTLLGAFLTAV